LTLGITEFKLTGDPNCILFLKETNVIRASVRYALTVEEFFALNGETKFVERMAAVLGIDPTRIRIVGIQIGSVII